MTAGTVLVARKGEPLAAGSRRAPFSKSARRGTPTLFSAALKLGRRWPAARTFRPAPGEKVGLVGSNGAGKTTLFGRLEPGSGSWVSVVRHVVPPAAKCVYN